MFLNSGIQRRSPLTMTKGFRNRGKRASKVLSQFYPFAALGSFYIFAIVKKPPWRICIDSKKNRGKSANPLILLSIIPHLSSSCLPFSRPRRTSSELVDKRAAIELDDGSRHDAGAVRRYESRDVGHFLQHRQAP